MPPTLHLLHPLWLLALIPTGWLFVLLRNQQDATSQWSRVIAPKLLPYLVDKPTAGQRVRPYRLLIASLVISILALSGPAWQREPSPFSEDEAPLVIALELAPSMTVTDIQPSRLERGKQKARDLLAQRSTGKTALVAYAGSAHLVMPLTDDLRIIETYLADLSPDIMPLPGNAPALALNVAEAALEKAPGPGSIVFISDGIGTDQTAAFIDHQQHSENDVAVLAIGTLEGGPIPDADAASTATYSRLDRQGLDALTRQTRAYVTEVTTDPTDIRRLDQHIQRHLAQVQQSDSDQWRNEGYWLLYPLAILMLFWFRQGWTIQWLAIFLVVNLIWSPSATASPLITSQPSWEQCIANANAPYIFQLSWERCISASNAPYDISYNAPHQISPLVPCSLSLATSSSPPPPLSPFPYLATLPPSLLNLWLTPDQQGRWLLDHGQYAEAADRFTDPLWKGVAYYVNEDFEAAAAQFEQVTPKTPDVYFDLANAYAQQEDYETALQNYDRALAMRIDYEDAQVNRDLVQARYDREQELAKERPEEQEGDLKADKVVEDDTPPPDQENDHPRPNQDGMGAIGMTDLWLQNVQTTPADFLRQKFQYQLESENQTPKEALKS